MSADCLRGRREQSDSMKKIVKADDSSMGEPSMEQQIVGCSLEESILNRDFLICSFMIQVVGAKLLIYPFFIAQSSN